MNEYEIHPDEVDINYKPGFFRQMESFIKMVRNGSLESPGINLEEALKTMELVYGIYSADPIWKKKWNITL